MATHCSPTQKPKLFIHSLALLAGITIASAELVQVGDLRIRTYSAMTHLRSVNRYAVDPLAASGNVERSSIRSF